MQFVLKPTVVDAFQMERAELVCRDGWPWWLIVAFNKERGSVGSCYVSVTASGVAPMNLTLITLEGPRLVHEGDWIVSEADGLAVYKTHDFVAKYAPRDRWL